MKRDDADRSLAARPARFRSAGKTKPKLKIGGRPGPLRYRRWAWLTADAHYAAAHYYDPAQARFQDFDGFWEFVAGPLHASSYGAKELDDTFGPRVVFCAEGGSLLDRYSA